MNGGCEVTNQDRARVRQIYPYWRTSEVDSFLRSLADRRGARLTELEAQFASLKQTLDAWHGLALEWPAQEGKVVRATDYARSVIRMKLLNSWQEVAGEPVYSRSHRFMGYKLSFNGFEAPTLPVLPAGSFPFISFIDLGHMSLLEVPAEFLRAFPHLKTFEAPNNRLTQVPAALGEQARLVTLDVANNDLTTLDAPLLQRCTALRRLTLRGNPLEGALDLSALTWLTHIDLVSMGLTRMPSGLRALVNLEILDLRDNQITQASNELLDPADEDPVGMRRIFIATYLDGNPFSAQGLDDYAEVHVRVTQPGRVPQGPLAVTAPEPVIASASERLAQWMRDVPEGERAARTERWTLLNAALIEREAPGVAPDGTILPSEKFFRLLSELSKTDDYKNAYSDLATRVWALLDAAAESGELRESLFELAGEVDTCQDGITLVFSRLELRRLSDEEVGVVDDAQASTRLLKLAQGLFRLDEVERIAQRDADTRLEVIAQSHDTLKSKVKRALAIDRVEIRLAYRIGLRDRLGLPGQPQEAVYLATAQVTPQMLAAAEAEVLGLEGSAKAFIATTQREFWQVFLQRKYADQFAANRDPILARLEALSTEDDLTSERYRDASNALMNEWSTLKQALIKGLTAAEMAEQP